MVGVALPGVALAGKKVTSGQQTLQIKVGLSSRRAAAQHVTLRFHYDYRSTTPGQQPPYNTKTITFVLPAGMVLNPFAAPACKRSQIDKNAGDVGKCPRKTIVGNGTVVANAAPTISAPITGTVTIYNAVNNVGIGQPKGTRNLILWVKTSLGVNQAIPFRVIMRGRREKLRATFTKPSRPGVTPGSFTVQTVTLSTRGSGKRSFITNPATCTRSWQFALNVVNYFNQPPITATDSVRCQS
jgi:hypothetical protein